MQSAVYLFALVALLVSSSGFAREDRDRSYRDSDKYRSYSSESRHKRRDRGEHSPHSPRYDSYSFSRHGARDHRQDRYHRPAREHRDAHRGSNRSDAFWGGVIVGALASELIHETHYSRAQTRPYPSYHRESKRETRYWRDRFGSCFRVESRLRGAVYVKVARHWCY